MLDSHGFQAIARGDRPTFIDATVLQGYSSLRRMSGVRERRRTLDLSYGTYRSNGAGCAGRSTSEHRRASAAPGPGITEVTRIEERPNADIQLTITAKVTERIAALETVTLYHRLQYEDEVAVPMTNAGQGTYSATIPAVADAGQMLR